MMMDIEASGEGTAKTMARGDHVTIDHTGIETDRLHLISGPDRDHLHETDMKMAIAIGMTGGIGHGVSVTTVLPSLAHVRHQGDVTMRIAEIAEDLTLVQDAQDHPTLDPHRHIVTERPIIDGHHVASLTHRRRTTVARQRPVMRMIELPNLQLCNLMPRRWR